MIKTISPFWIWLVLGLALILRLPQLNSSFWLDEAAQALESARPLSQQLDIAFDFQPPLLHLLVHLAEQISRQEWWLRAGAALLPGLITIWACYQIGAQLQSKLTGLIAALLLSTSSFHIFYSQELRPYSLPAMWACLSWLVLFKIDKDSPAWWMLIYAIITLLGLYTSYLYPFLLLAQVVYLLLFSPALIKRFVATSWLWLIGFLIWLPRFWTQLKVGSLVRQQLPGWEQVVSAPQFKALSLVWGKFVFGVLDLEVNLMFGLISLVVLAGLSYLGLQSLQLPTRKRQPLAVLLIWLVLPIVSAWLVSFWIPVLSPKRVLFTLPAFYLSVSVLITLGLKQTRSRSGRLTAWLLAGALLVLNVFSASSYFSNPRLQREDWRTLHLQIITKYPAKSSILISSFPDTFAPWVWYDDGSYPTLATGQLNIELADDLPSQLKVITDYQYVLVFDYLRDLTDPNDRLLTEIKQFGYQEITVIDQAQIGFVRVFARKNTLLTWKNL